MRLLTIFDHRVTWCILNNILRRMRNRGFQSHGENEQSGHILVIRYFHFPTTSKVFNTWFGFSIQTLVYNCHGGSDVYLHRYAVVNLMKGFFMLGKVKVKEKLHFSVPSAGIAEIEHA